MSTPKKSNLFAGLNASQTEAVFHTHGPLLVLAGAGSGKTRVLTTRIARIIAEKHAEPSSILAVTFTNKAAAEMKARIAAVTSKKTADAMTVSTFHSLGARILRENGEKIGIKPKFSILNDYERTATIKGVMRSIGKRMADEDHDGFATAISLAKNASLDPAEYEQGDETKVRTARVYKNYSSMLLKRQSVDFDDLLLLPLRILQQHPDVLAAYRAKYSFVSVDEFQDTNVVQLKLALLLAAPKNNIMVVGDDDQGIYSWRGAVLDNILSFPTFFPQCKSVILDTNYRSSRQIVDGANAVVCKNRTRKLKSIIAANGDGDLIEHYKGDDEEEEAQWVAATIKSHVDSKEFSFADHALLFRTNAVMRRFEEALRANKISYKTVGAQSFFERKEVKDILAYLRLFANTDDELSLMRTLKVPDKGLSKETFEALDECASNRKTSLFTSLRHVENIAEISAPQAQKICAFLALYDRYSALFSEKPKQAAEIFRALLTECNYFALLERAYKETGDSAARLEHIEELIHGLDSFAQKHAATPMIIAEYLREISLVFSENEKDHGSGFNAVTLMTMHKAKGLEFPVVIVPALDNSIIPSPRALAEGNLEEERRLFYVAMTRARKRLILTYPGTKIFRSSLTKVTPCRFLSEIPEEFLDGPLGEKQAEHYQDFVEDFFKQMQDKLGPPQDDIENPTD